jgi:hypothetical protein
MTVTKCDFCRKTTDVLFRFIPTDVTFESPAYKKVNISNYDRIRKVEMCYECAKYMIALAPIVED